MNLIRAQPELLRVLFVKFREHELVQLLGEILEVGHVSRSTKDCVRANGMQTLNIFESCKRAIGSCFERSEMVARWIGDEQTHPDYLQQS